MIENNDKPTKKHTDMKTYLVTGAAGFIGANFIKYLLYKKYANKLIADYARQVMGQANDKSHE